MPFQYIDPPSGPLKQGEILCDVWEHRALHSAGKIDEGSEVGFKSLLHPRLIILSQECDLLWDYQAREKFSQQEKSDDINPEESKLLQHILLADLYEKEEVKSRFKGLSDIWRRIPRNQDERYHCLPAASISNQQENQLPELYLDFKKILSYPPDQLYEAITSSQVGRVAVVPPFYLHDLIHRFYSFHSRVAVPE